MKSKYPNIFTKYAVTVIQFIWVAVNNITAVTGYFSVMMAIHPLKYFDMRRYDEWERWLFFIQFKFCASWGFENNWQIFQSGDVSFNFDTARHLLPLSRYFLPLFLSHFIHLLSFPHDPYYH